MQRSDDSDRHGVHEATRATSSFGPSHGVLASLALPMLAASLGTSSANVALPTLARAFGASFREVQWVVIAYLLAVTTTVVAVGRLGDRLGRRRLLEVGLVVFALAACVSATATSLSLVVVARAVQGLGAAAMTSLSIALAGQNASDETTGRAMGLLGTTSSIGTALGPSFGGGLVAALGWRSVFIAHVALAVAGLVLARRHLPDDPPSSVTRGGFDAFGTALLGVSIASYALAMTLGGSSRALAALLLAVALTGVIAFLYVERRVDAPLLRPTLFDDAAMNASLAASLLVSIVVMASLVVGPFYLSIGLGLGPGRVGMVMSMGPLVAAMTGIPAGRLVDRVGTGATMVLGLVGMALGTLALSFSSPRFGVAGYVMPMVLITSSYASFQAANNTEVMRRASTDERGLFSGTLSLSRSLGLVTGASLLGAVFAFASGTADVARADSDGVAAGMSGTYRVAAALVTAALVWVARDRLTRRDDRVEEGPLRP